MIEVYSFEDADGNETGFTTQDANEAREYAQSNGYKWIAMQFEFTGSELVEDYSA